jgi:hypothetical protein
VGSTDARFGVIGVLFPFDGFQRVYQGVAGDVPIAFPGGRDAHAPDAGYDDNLAQGLPVPRGARLSIGLPLALDAEGTIVDYAYAFVFRDRNIHDGNITGDRGRRQPWHYAREGLGAPDTSLAATQRYFPIDARWDCIGYEQAEPVLPAGRAFLHLYPELVIPRQLLRNRPLLPGGALASFQQGIYDPTFVTEARNAMRDEIQRDANGDDLIILAFKLPNEEGQYAPWDFTGVDYAFSNIYGTGNGTHQIFTDGGIRVCPGSNP